MKMTGTVELEQEEKKREKTPISIWRNKNFLTLWLGSIITDFGFQLYIIALPLLIYDLTQSGLAMSGMRVVEFLPNIVLGMLAGVFVDRMDRKRVMSLMSLIQIIALGAMTTLLWMNQMMIVYLYLFGFILSAASYTFGNAHHAVIPTIVDKEQLTEVNAKFSLNNTLIQLIGPGFAGFFLALTSYEMSFTFYLLCLMGLFVSVRMLQLPQRSERKTPSSSSIWEDLKEGLSELLQNKTLLTPTITIVLINLASSFVIGIRDFYAVDQLGADEKQIGFIYSIGAIGAVLGTLWVNRLRKRFGRGNVFVYCLLFDLTGLIFLISASVWWMIGIAMFFRGLGISMINIIYFSIRQEFTPNHLLGRVAGTSSMMMKLSLPLGLLLSGIWSEYFPVRILFILSAVLVILLFWRLIHHPIHHTT